MPKEDESVGALLLGGLAGYAIAQDQNSEWKPLIEAYKKRLQALNYAKIPLLFPYVSKVPNMRVVYEESVRAHLFGLPNSCLPSILRVLEQALIRKYQETEKNEPKGMSLDDLIRWSETTLKELTPIAHSFRMLRNYIHTDRLIAEQDSLEAIRHVSIVIDRLFPWEQSAMMPSRCTLCGFLGNAHVPEHERFLANTLSMSCGVCRRTYQ